jgi:hypothetical protein
VRRFAPLTSVALAGALVLAGCRSGSVRIDFRPRLNGRYAYTIDVKASTTTAIDGRTPTRNASDQRLQARHVVQEVDRAGVVVDVHVTGQDVPDRSFEVRLDRAASLVEVQRVQDIPTSVLGDLGLSEVFTAAAGAPPDRALRPGARWTIDEPVSLPGARTVRLTGAGRLTELGVVDGRQVATVVSTYKLPVHQTSTGTEGTVTLDGDQTTDTTATHALTDGAVQSVRARTVGRFRLTLAPPAGANGAVLQGHLDVEVESVTRRQR